MLPDDVDTLVHELSASLLPSQRHAFIDAARAALAAAGCSGCGAAYRVLAPLQRTYWDPPPDQRVGEPRHYRPSKLADAEPIGEPSRPDRARAVLFARSRAAG